ncbi:MAG: hypothetical protein ACJAZN_001111 [Planctomycetota bacterium]|jgi:hypothetical protein
MVMSGQAQEGADLALGPHRGESRANGLEIHDP